MTFYDLSKRIVDILGSIFALSLFFPIIIITTIWIKIVSSKGSVLADTPERVGKGGENFRFFKFRSMIPNAHQWLLEHPDLYKKYQDNDYKLEPDEDPRLLPGAKFIRKYSIDEFPQFFNVLFGDMSLVGPRAYYQFEVEEQTRKFPETQKYINDVLSVKPGITGVWQIKGRSEISFPVRVKMDAEYAKRRSLVYDLLIILRTPWVVLTAKGAR